MTSSMQGNKKLVHGIKWTYLVILLVIIIFSFCSFGLKVIPSEATELPLNSAFVFSRGFLNFLLTVLLALVIICAVIIVLSLKLKKANRELILRNRQIEEINKNLVGLNQELVLQKDIVTREFLETDKFFKILIQSADDGISFFDKEGNLKFANPAFYSVIGFDKDSYYSVDPAVFIHPDDIGYPAERLEALMNKDFHESELRLYHKDGHYVNLSTRSVTVKEENGNIIGALTISRDITKMKQVHEELVKANVEAETSNRLKSSFLANISHEIRTPLNSVVGFSNLLLSNDLTQELKEEYVEHINHNSEKLLQIIGDIIDLSRLESSQIEITYEEASVNAIVNEVVDEARQGIKRNDKSIILNVKNLFEDNADLVFTDKIWLKRVLNHLMDNAVKFTLDGSIEFSYSRENENLVFKISDTGIGIKKENLNRIFDEFRQESDGHHRPFEGLGIGLTLAKEVVERMGGKISVHSEKGIGSEFSFSIPYRPAGSTRAKLKDMFREPVIAKINWSTKKCLLVDDNRDVLIYLNRILLDTGITVIKARSGPEAIEIISSTPDIDVVLLDMQMPEMNGIEATKLIRKIRKDLPIIAQTAFIFEDDKDIILEAGCDACLIKPIRKEHLITVMSSFIKSE
ncbi:MAG TPA: ATP-binding protein [Bacteroidales bacterium]|nr:ATP-binding protein [Bacteroidales bacterium]